MKTSCFLHETEHHANLLNYHRSRAGANAVMGITGNCRDRKTGIYRGSTWMSADQQNPSLTTETRRRGEVFFSEIPTLSFVEGEGSLPKEEQQERIRDKRYYRRST